MTPRQSSSSETRSSEYLEANRELQELKDLFRATAWETLKRVLARERGRLLSRLARASSFDEVLRRQGAIDLIDLIVGEELEEKELAAAAPMATPAEKASYMDPHPEIPDDDAA